jgi:predicted Zn-dependent protease
MTHVMAHEMVHVLDLSELLQSASTEEWVVEHPVVAVAARPGYQQKLPLLFSRLR